MTQISCRATIWAVQSPMNSGFDVTSTAQQVIDGINLAGRVAIVTGGVSGIGVETVRAFLYAGASVVVPARNPIQAWPALDELRDVEIETMDLMDPASIASFAERFEVSGRPLHILVASAGIGGAPLSRDSRGYESHFATNHLGHFDLVSRLRPALRRAEGARVVIVSSWSHRSSDIVFDDPNYQRRDYDPATAYGQSKTANVLFALALDELSKSEGVRAFSLHPGTIVDTRFNRHIPQGVLEAVGMVDADGAAVLDPSKGWKSVEQGAATSVWCATSPDLEGKGGLYAQDCDIAPLLDHADPEVIAADIVGSTKRAVELGDQRWRDLLVQHHGVVRNQLDRFRGKEIDTADDGFLAIFDGPARAIRCALEICESVRSLGIETRAGLHTGEVEVIGEKIGGIAVHIGARVSSLAEPGEVLVSRTVVDLVSGSGVEFDDRGDHELKGVPGTWNLFAVRA